MHILNSLYEAFTIINILWFDMELPISIAVGEKHTRFSRCLYSTRKKQKPADKKQNKTPLFGILHYLFVCMHVIYEINFHTHY